MKHLITFEYVITNVFLKSCDERRQNQTISSTGMVYGKGSSGRHREKMTLIGRMIL